MDAAPTGQKLGRPRSELAREAVLQAVDDLLVEVGYAAMTMKGIAESAGVGRQTVYRWWSSKAEILLEACVEDAREELSRAQTAGTAAAQLTHYLLAVANFLTHSPAGLGYRALLGEAQHDPEVRDLVARADVLGRPTAEVLDRVRSLLPGMPAHRLATAQLIGPVVYDLLVTGTRMPQASLRVHVDALAETWLRPV